MTIQIRKISKVTINFILSYLFPKEPIVEYLEELGPAQFEALCRPANHTPKLWISSLFNFEDSIVQAAIHEVKYMKNDKIARLFRETLRGKISQNLTQLRENTLIVPIPARPMRMKQYGYNQNNLILDSCRIPFVDLLVRIKDGESQTGLAAKKRAENVSGAFVLNKGTVSSEKIQESFIILFDDVATTGATLSAAREALLQVGAKEVVAITLAA